MSPLIRKGLQHAWSLLRGSPPRLLSRSEAFEAADAGWGMPEVALRQDEAYRTLIRGMESGLLREDLAAARQAIRDAGIAEPRILEVGCGSGYYAEILPHLLERPLHYSGLDRSEAMISLARRRYPRVPFLLGDACRLPFRDAAFDLVFHGSALMHILDSEGAVYEARRVTRRWVVFQTVPTVFGRGTQYLAKRAYGEPVVEVVLGDGEFEELLRRGGLARRAAYPSVPHPYLEKLLGEIRVMTYLCEAC